VESVFLGGRTTGAERVWARHLGRVREQTVAEVHLTRWASPFWALPPRRAMRIAASGLASDLRPAVEEPWRSKLRRSLRALGNAGQTKSQHEEELGPDARQLRR
jgi:hypothetical protein